MAEANQKFYLQRPYHMPVPACNDKFNMAGFLEPQTFESTNSCLYCRFPNRFHLNLLLTSVHDGVINGTNYGRQLLMKIYLTFIYSMSVLNIWSLSVLRRSNYSLFDKPKGLNSIHRFYFVYVWQVMFTLSLNFLLHEIEMSNLQDTRSFSYLS